MLGYLIGAVAVIAVLYGFTVGTKKQKLFAIMALVASGIAGYTWMFISIDGADVGTAFLRSIIATGRMFAAEDDAADYYMQLPRSAGYFFAAAILLAMSLTVISAISIIANNLFFAIKLRLILLFRKAQTLAIFSELSERSMKLARDTECALQRCMIVFISSESDPDIAASARQAGYFILSDYGTLPKTKTRTLVFLWEERQGDPISIKLCKRMSDLQLYYINEHSAGFPNFSLSDMTVRYLFAEAGFVPAGYTGNESANICVVGANDTAVKLVKELIVQCQSVSGIPRITVVGESARDAFAYFRAICPALPQCVEWNFVDSSPLSENGISVLTGAGFHFYCLCVEREVADKISVLLPPEKCVLMPDSDVLLTYETIVGERLDKMAKAVNCSYLLHFTAAQGVDAEKEWQALNEFQKESNRSTARHLPSKRYLLQCGVPLAQIHELEHLRWNAFHFVNGWRTGCDMNGKKDKARRLHPLLIPYGDLSQEEKDKDAVLTDMLLGLEG